MATRLTANTRAGGCASKLSPKILDRALRTVPRLQNENVLVGYDNSDDAGVYNLTQAAGGHPLGLVQTVDFFTPIVDDPYTFGAIAAANALSDIYAMGGTPVTALSLVVFPPNGDVLDLEAILKGGADKIHEANCVILGGHSIAEDEIKFGYAVTGLIDPARIWTNAGARADDVLVFTKRLGTGVISSALKQGIADPSHVNAAVMQMLMLNRDIALALAEEDVHACTDVTGFGLLGHAREMAIASHVTLEIDVSTIRFLPGAVEYSQRGSHSGGLRNNRDFVESCVQMDKDIVPEIQALLYDPQTSGGLLLSLDKSVADRLLDLHPDVYVIGRVRDLADKPLVVKS